MRLMLILRVQMRMWFASSEKIVPGWFRSCLGLSPPPPFANYLINSAAGAAVSDIKAL